MDRDELLLEMHGTIGRVDERLKAMDRRVKRIEVQVDNLPCKEHGEALSTLRARSGLWGMMGGALAVVAAQLGIKGYQ